MQRALILALFSRVILRRSARTVKQQTPFGQRIFSCIEALARAKLLCDIMSFMGWLSGEQEPTILR